MKKITLKMAMLSIVLLFGSLFTANAQTAPVVDSVATVIGVTRTAAFSGCFVSSDGGAAITEKGICVSTTSNPAITDTKFTTYKISTPTYEPCAITGLQPSTTYYVRAYATNSVGTSYSSTQKQFTTSANNIEVVWPCKADLIASPTGAVTASAIAIDKFMSGAMAWDQNSGTSSPTTEISWPAPTGLGKFTSTALTLATFSSNVYLYFSITSTASAFRINKLTVSALGYKTGNMRLKIASSLDNFTTADTISAITINDATRTATTISTGLSTANPVLTTSMGKENIVFSPNITVPAGQTVYFRIYSWGKAGSGIMMKNLTVSGTTDLSTSVNSLGVSNCELKLVNISNELKIENAANIQQLDILSVNGKMLRSFKNSKPEIQLTTNDLQSGMYIVRAHTENGIQTGKFIK